MRTLQVDIEGLDLVLGGGFALLERVAGAGESATILIRGPAGSGKTVLGTQFAASIARALGSDVAYGCVELLPAELRAQHESVRSKSAREKVVFLHEDAEGDPNSDVVRIYTGLLDLGEEGAAAAQLGDAVNALLGAANDRAKRDVRVLVIDSLSEGYGLGAGAPRILADGVSKFAAERGLVVILLEEQAYEGSSVWGFAVDIVFELKPAEETMSFERRLLVPKNRLGPSDPGPHEFSVRNSGGVVIYPRVAAYQKRWRNTVLVTQAISTTVDHPWYPFGRIKGDWLPGFRHVTSAVVGIDSTAVRRMALWLGARILEVTPDHAAVLGPEIRMTIGVSGSPGGLNSSKWKREYSNYAWGITQSGASMMYLLRRELEAQARRGKVPLRVLIGDLHSVNYHPDPKEAIQAVSAIASLLRDLGVPLVLYETTDASHASSVAAVNAGVLCSCLGELQEDETQDEEDETQDEEDEAQGHTSRKESLEVRLGTVWKSMDLTIRF